ncbi:MAG: 2OG-Fe(II) oxygenase [Acidimicrobiales bacterium]|nr:2OG-Fe(II) oxygenase [Acidimicrobiales bacterium]
MVVDIMGQRIDGMTVRGVFRPEEVERAVASLPQHRAHETPVVFGTVLARPLMQSGMSRDRTQHLDDADRFREEFREMFGFDPHERLAELFATMSGGLPLTAPREDGRSYNPGQIRIMEPDGGGLAAHAGNEFLISNKEGSADHLWETTDALDHMSYFVVLQRPDRGGELSVYDKLWEDPRDQGDGPSIPLTHEAAYFDDLAHLTIDPDPGDLVVFRGGRRWHRVEEVFGSRPRLTYGGFAAPSHDRTEIHCWA